jgi:hypothetical protein
VPEVARRSDVSEDDAQAARWFPAHLPGANLLAGRSRISLKRTSWGSTIKVPVEQIQTIEFVRSGIPVLTASFG